MRLLSAGNFIWKINYEKLHGLESAWNICGNLKWILTVFWNKFEEFECGKTVKFLKWWVLTEIGDFKA